LRILAGLEKQDAGTLSMAGRDIGKLPPGKRDYGIVFQSYALFPNLTVAENIAYGLTTNRASKQTRVRELLDLVGLAGSDAKYPSQLSGGQQQRVALARALATAPSLLLLDEPLSALDAQVREHLRRELRDLQQKLGVTTVMVTHDQDEALALADRMAVMRNGRIEQVGSPEQIYHQPASRFVAEFVGHANWLPVEIGNDGQTTLAGVPLPMAHTSPAGKASAFCRPEDVCVDTRWEPGSTALMARVDRIDFMGSVRRVTLALAADRQVKLLADVGANDPALAAIVPGQMAPLRIPAERLRIFPADAA
jgi:iron(III) transport system ATP-binding protein